MKAPHPDTARFTRLLHEEALRAGVQRPIFEVRIVKSPQKTISGYFDDPDKAAAAIADKDGKHEAIYITPNPTHVDCFARAANHLKPYADATTSDAQIIRRLWLLIDIDPVRPKGVSSTDPQHEAAFRMALEIRSFLAGTGFGKPIVGDSGNGAHLMYRIDMPNDEPAKILIKNCLEALDKRFSNAVVKIDTTTFNASRIWKVYGTMARKGEDLPEQPHRRAWLVPEDA